MTEQFDDEDPREFRESYLKKAHIVRPDVPDYWDAIKVMVWIGRKGRGEVIAYCGTNVSTYARKRYSDSLNVCASCLKGYHADEDAD